MNRREFALIRLSKAICYKQADIQSIIYFDKVSLTACCKFCFEKYVTDSDKIFSIGKRIHFLAESCYTNIKTLCFICKERIILITTASNCSTCIDRYLEIGNSVFSPGRRAANLSRR